MTQKDFEELEAKYNKMVGLMKRQEKAYEFMYFMKACTTPSGDDKDDYERLCCCTEYENTKYGIEDIDAELADELLPVIKSFCEKLEKEFEEE